MENLLRNTDSTSITTVFIWTYVFLTRRHTAHTGSLGGTCWNSSHCGRMPSALENGAQITAHECWTPAKPLANPVDTEIHAAASERGGIDSTCGDQMGPASHRRLPAEGRQTSVIFASSGQLLLRKRNRDSTCCEKTRQLTHTGHSGSTA